MTGSVPPRMRLLAHQGTRVFAPENSIPGFELAARMGFYGINFARIRASAEGTLYIMHDPTVDRTTDGSGAIAEMTDAEIARLTLDCALPCAEYRLSDFSREQLRVPTLEDGVRICLRYGLVPMLRFGLEPEDGGGLPFRRLRELITDYGLEGRMLLSGSVGALLALDAFYPDTPKIFWNGDADVSEMIRTFDACPFRRRDTVYAMLRPERLTAPELGRLRRAGYRPYAANPNDRDDPEHARQVFAELASLGCEYANAERLTSY